MPKVSTLRRGHGLGVVRTMPEFRDYTESQTPLSKAQRRTLVEQAEILIRDLYVHLPLKKAMHAVEPEQRLRLLIHRMDQYTDREFHTRLQEIFIDLRDLHTNYMLPNPYRGKLAFLGILLERYIDADENHWMVSKVFDHLVTDSALKEGAVVTHWNGVPIELAVWRNADREAGSNQPARFARGIENMTLRVLVASLPPDEDWVDLRYETNTSTKETRLEWRVFEGVSEILAGSVDPSGLLEGLRTPLRYQVGVDMRTELTRRAKKQLFSPGARREERRVAKYSTKKYAGKLPRATKAQKAASIIPTTRPDDLTARIVDTNDGSFGYLRLWTFHMRDQNINAYLGEVIRLLDTEFPPEGLIIDVRGNGGGYIIAAEFILQLLTPRIVAPEPTQFINTAATLSLTKQDQNMADWKDSIAQAIETGAQYSKGIPLSPPEIVNSFGQIYHGPIVLITDALCYSACDMFAAGFKDHEIGKIIGVDANTGAGGANVLEHSQLRQSWAGGPLVPLPKEAGMRVSLRRTLRVGERAGQPVEDLGIEPDILYEMSRNDLLNGNIDLLNRAGQVLAAAGTVRQLDAAIVGSSGQNVDIDISTINVTSVDIYVNDRPQTTVQTPDGTHQVTVQLPSSGSPIVRLVGFARGQLVASRLLDLS